MQHKRNENSGRVLNTQLVISAYVQGFFPMGDEATGQVHWFSPEVRGILPLNDFHVSRSWQRAVKSSTFEIRCDTAFAEVVEQCAKPRSDDDGVWITEPIQKTYCELHDLGIAHSVEAWLGDRLVGGIYGLAIRSAFFGESMFSRPDHDGTNASKVALWHLVHHLKSRGYTLFDAQYLNEHTRQLGFIEIKRADYLTHLNKAINVENTTWGEFQTPNE